MGLKNYFKAQPKGAAKAAPQPDVSMSSMPPMREKAPSPGFTNLDTPRYGSSRASLAPSTRSSTFVDEIKHEVMCNYLYQQQCSHLWVSDASGELEGVLLRKSKHNYMACPPQLAVSPFAQAIAAMNCQVCTLHDIGKMQANEAGRDDR